jgi:hypothetical protein
MFKGSCQILAHIYMKPYSHKVTLKHGQKWKNPWSKDMNRGSNKDSSIAYLPTIIREIFINFGAADN